MNFKFQKSKKELGKHEILRLKGWYNRMNVPGCDFFGTLGIDLTFEI